MPITIPTSQSIQKEPSAIKNRQQGFSITEALIAVFIIGLVATAISGTLLYGSQSSAISGNRSRANLLAEEGLEAVRNIRDQQFSNLVDGTYGLQKVSNSWNLSGSSDTTDIFSRQINVSTISTSMKKVTATITWNQNFKLNNTVTAATYLGNIGLLKSQANTLTINATNAKIAGGGNKELQGITLSNSGATAIVIDKITISWTTTDRQLQAIRINGTDYWTSTGPGTPTGTQKTGTVIDIQNYTLAAGASNIPITRFLFNGSMLSNSFTITFTLGDGSTKTISYP